MRDATAAIGRYSQICQRLSIARGDEAASLSKMAEQHRTERDRVVRLYEDHMLQHREQQFMTA
jgi:hypothetical protein